MTSLLRKRLVLILACILLLAATPGVLAEECGDLLREFFAQKRQQAEGQGAEGAAAG